MSRVSIPDSFLCPITSELMADPVTTADGFTYEREAINEWFNSGHNTSPLTGATLPDKRLTPVNVLKSIIQEWEEEEHEKCMAKARPRRKKAKTA